jgi:4-amino-4-deoxy-L-arabinose transferase-like glycosyltransferase
MMTPEHRRAGGGRVDVVGLLLVCVFLSTVCLGAPLVDPDEPRTAIVARLMVDRGDWLSPHLPAAFHNHYPHDPIEGDLLAYWDKPPLFFWLAALGMKVLGPSALAARLPAAASFVATVLLVFAAVRHLRGRRASLIAGVAAAVSPLAVALAHVARMETLLMALMTAMLVASLRLMDDRPKSWLWTMVLYVCAGLGLLTKGLVAVVLPAAAVFATIVVLGRWRDIGSLRPFSGIAIVLAVSAPWFVYMHLRYPPGAGSAGFTQSFFIGQHLTRVTTETFGHKHIPGFLLACLIGGGLPWTFFLPGALAWGWHEFWDRRETRSLILLPVLWAAAVVGAFSISSTQMLHYVLPAVPAMAILVGGYLDVQVGSLQRNRLFKATCWLTVIALAMAVVAIPPVLALKATWRASHLIFLVPLALVVIAGAAALHKRLYSWGLVAAAASTGLILTFAFAADPVGIYQYRTTRFEAQLVSGNLREGDGLTAYPDIPFSFWWYMWPRPVFYPTPLQNFAGHIHLKQLIAEIKNHDRTFVLLPKNVDLDRVRMKVGRPVTVLSSRPKHTLVIFTNETPESGRKELQQLPEMNRNAARSRVNFILDTQGRIPYGPTPKKGALVTLPSSVWHTAMTSLYLRRERGISPKEVLGFPYPYRHA